MGSRRSRSATRSTQSRRAALRSASGVLAAPQRGTPDRELVNAVSGWLARERPSSERRGDAVLLPDTFAGIASTWLSSTGRAAAAHRHIMIWMKEWGFAQTDASQELAQLHFFSMK